MSIRTNYHRQLVDDEFPLAGSAVARSINFKTAQTVLVDGPQKRQLLLSRLAVVSTNVDTVSNGATVVITERDPRTKTKATLSTTLSGANNDIVLTAVNGGTAGNSITLTLVAPGTNNAALGIVVTGNSIVANLATDGSAVVTTTATQLLAAIAASAAATALVTGALKGADTGAGVVTALSATNLTGGLEWTVVQTVVASTDLADSDANGKSQLLTIATGASPIQPGNQLALAITAGTATTDVKDFVVEGTIY